MRTFDAFAVAYNVRTPDLATAVQHMWPVDEQFFGHRAEVDRWSVTEAPTGHPVLRYYRATLDCAPVQVHDVPARFADRRVVGAWLELSSAWGAPAQLALPLHFGHNDHRAFVLGRMDPFTPGELELFDVLQRLLIGVDRQVVALRGVAPTPRAWAAAESARLTARELAVLGQVAKGLTATAVGRSLGIVPSTVHKHLERVYTKLGVRDRLGAVLRAQQLGLLRPQPPG